VKKGKSSILAVGTATQAPTITFCLRYPWPPTVTWSCFTSTAPAGQTTSLPSATTACRRECGPTWPSLGTSTPTPTSCMWTAFSRLPRLMRAIRTTAAPPG